MLAGKVGGKPTPGPFESLDGSGAWGENTKEGTKGPLFKPCVLTILDNPKRCHAEVGPGPFGPGSKSRTPSEDPNPR